MRYLPALQVVHPLAPAAEYRPTPHTPQLTLPGSGAKVPGPHALQAVRAAAKSLVDQVPAGHGVQVGAAGGAKLPLGHKAQPLLAPPAAVPAPQGVHSALPAPAK